MIDERQPWNGNELSDAIFRLNPFFFQGLNFEAFAGRENDIKLNEEVNAVVIKTL